MLLAKTSRVFQSIASDGSLGNMLALADLAKEGALEGLEAEEKCW